jgi:hypothetical protein
VFPSHNSSVYPLPYAGALVLALLSAFGCSLYNSTTDNVPELALAALFHRAYPSLPVTTGIYLRMDPSSIVASGSSVTSWDDLGPLGLHLPLDTNAPTFVSNYPYGLPAVRFPADPDLVGLRRNSGSTTLTSTFTFLSVFRFNSPASGRSIISFGTGCLSVPGNITIYVNGANKLVLDKMSDGNIFVSAAALSPDAVTTVLVVSDPGTNTTSWSINGTTDGTTAEAGPFTVAPGIWAGTGCTTGSGNFNGDIQEMIMYSRALSSQEQRSLECYASSKYDIPIGHSCP